MQTIISKLLEQRFRAAFEKLGFAASFPIVLQESSKPEFGDYQVNGVMAIAKQLKVNPRELAAKIVEKLETKDLIAKLEIAGPGFINITLSNEYLNQVLTKDLLSVAADRHHKTVIDYSSPNLAKEMHIGHLRSTIIGDALVRVLSFAGHEVIRQNHGGEWGTQFGMLLEHLIETGSTDATEFSIGNLDEFYIVANNRFESDPAFADRARARV